MKTRWYQKLQPGRMAVYGTCMVVAIAASTLSFTIGKENRPFTRFHFTGRQPCFSKSIFAGIQGIDVATMYELSPRR